MNNEFNNQLVALEKEIQALKQAKLKWAGVIGTQDHPMSATFTVTELQYALFSSKALYITATNPNGDSFLSDLLFTGSWDGRGWAKNKIYETKGQTQWCLAMVIPTSNDYTRYYDQGGDFDISLSFIIRASSAVNITTSWGNNPYATSW